MFPNAGNVFIKLLKTHHISDSIGQKKLIITSSKEVIGITFSVTSKEFYESKSLNERVDMAVKIQAILYDHSKYALIQGIIYRIERTYINGQFIELYLVAANLRESDFIVDSG